MKILSIETSCDETALSVLEVEGGATEAEFKVLGNALLSQIDIHKKYGGVFPTAAKREHNRNLLPILKQVLEEADFGNYKLQNTPNDKLTGQANYEQKIKKILDREPELLKQFLEFIPTIKIPEIDAIAVTVGPGLEPALWVGVNFARALALVWNKPLVPVNHMEGHIFSALLKKCASTKYQISNIKYPMVALLISGGHTQLVLSKYPPAGRVGWLKYEIVGETLDDAVGEAFDKTARMLGLPYPGGPEISRLAEQAQSNNAKRAYKFPRPMLGRDTCDFSFSGLKTAVLYTLKKIPEITEKVKQEIAKEFEDAVIEVLIAKTKKVLKEHSAKTLVIGGGVAANKRIRDTFEKMILDEYPDISLFTPERQLTTDNAIMIAVAGYFRFMQEKDKYRKQGLEIKADGNLAL